MNRRLPRTQILSALAIAILSGCSVDRLILHPTTQQVGSGGVPLYIDQPNEHRLHLMVRQTAAAEDDEPLAFVLVLGGNGDRAEWTVDTIAEAWTNFPVEVIALNYPGYGESAGPATLASVAESALRAYDAVAEKADGVPIFVQANSLGTAAALYVAAHRPVAGLVLLNPPPIKQVLRWYFGPLTFGVTAIAARHIPDSLDSLKTAPRCTCPAIFLLAGCDLLILPPFQKAVMNAYGGDKHSINLPGAAHNSAISGDKLTELRTSLLGLWRGAKLPEPQP